MSVIIVKGAQGIQPPAGTVSLIVDASGNPFILDENGNQSAVAISGNSPANTVRGNPTGSPAAAVDMTQAQITALLNAATESLQGAMSPTDKAIIDALPAASAGVWTSGQLDLTSTNAGVQIIPAVAKHLIVTNVIWDTITGPGTLSGAANISVGANSSSFNNLVGSFTPANSYTTGKQCVILTGAVTDGSGSNQINVVDLTTSGLKVKINTAATGGASAGAVYVFGYLV